MKNRSTKLFALKCLQRLPTLWYKRPTMHLALMSSVYLQSLSSFDGSLVEITMQTDRQTQIKTCARTHKHLYLHTCMHGWRHQNPFLLMYGLRRLYILLSDESFFFACLGRVQSCVKVVLRIRLFSAVYHKTRGDGGAWRRCSKAPTDLDFTLTHCPLYFDNWIVGLMWNRLNAARKWVLVGNLCIWLLSWNTLLGFI